MASRCPPITLVWWDIQRIKVLNGQVAKEAEDEKHICPAAARPDRALYHALVEPWRRRARLLHGHWQCAWRALQLGRRGVGIELKASYYRLACQFPSGFEFQQMQPTMFPEWRSPDVPRYRHHSAHRRARYDRGLQYSTPWRFRCATRPAPSAARRTSTTRCFRAGSRRCTASRSPRCAPSASGWRRRRTCTSPAFSRPKCRCDGADDDRSMAVTADTLKAPFPYFGGKSRIAGEVWARFGAVAELRRTLLRFRRGAAELPHARHTETVNDADGLFVNFWEGTAASRPGCRRAVRGLPP